MARLLWRRLTISKLLIISISTIILFYIYIAMFPIQQPCNCHNQGPLSSHQAKMPEQEEDQEIDRRKRLHEQAEVDKEYLSQGDDPRWGQHKLCVIVPYRERFEELVEFAPHIHKFLNAQRVRHKLVVVNQNDIYRFNRATLINIGFLQTEEDCDYMAMHDVDLLPLNPKLRYSYPSKGPYHVAAPNLHPKYHYSKFVGGILLMTREQFKKCNGLSTKYWGWGREDDEFYRRMLRANLRLYRPQNITTGFDTFKHFHEKKKRPRDYNRYGDQKKSDSLVDYITGLETTTYTSLERHELRIDGAPVTMLILELTCDLELTPWCLHPQQLSEIRQKQYTDQSANKAKKEALKRQVENAINQARRVQGL